MLLGRLEAGRLRLIQLRQHLFRIVGKRPRRRQVQILLVRFRGSRRRNDLFRGGIDRRLVDQRLPLQVVRNRLRRIDGDGFVSRRHCGVQLIVPVHHDRFVRKVHGRARGIRLRRCIVRRLSLGNLSL